MALTKITKTGLGAGAVDSTKIEADSIDATKIADNAISDEHLDATAISGQTELAEAAAGTDVLLIFDTSTGTLKKIQASNVGVQPPTISSVTPTSVLSGDGTGNYTFTITGTGFTAASASLVNNSGTGVAFDTVTVNSSTQITGVVAKSSLPGSGEPYDVKVTSSNGLAATLENQINIDASPTFNTASGSLGTVTDGARSITTLEVIAFDPESAGNVTFEIITGSLPAGASGTTVNEDGVSKFQISGFSAVGGNTTSTFTVRAADVNSNVSSREFTITVNVPVIESFTSSGTFSVPSGVTAINVLVVAGGGGGASSIQVSTSNGGAGAGGLIFMPGYPVTPGGTISVTVGCGGTGGTNPSPTNANNNMTDGQNSLFGAPGNPGLGQGGILTAIGGAKGSGYCGATNAGGSASGASINGTTCGVATQPTQPGNSGAYGFGSNGGLGSQAGSGPTGREPGNSGGGGGGAGAVGSNASGCAGGAGGTGRAYTIADGTTPVYYAGGGGGGGSPAGTGGQGGGGDGGTGQGIGGQANKGGGAGGSRTSGAGTAYNGNPGGKGIVIVQI